MARVAEALMDEIQNIAKLTGEAEEEVHKEWKEIERAGKNFGEFVVQKSRKRAKKKRL